LMLQSETSLQDIEHFGKAYWQHDNCVGTMRFYWNVYQCGT
jgi:hypothetical protein